MQSFTLHYCDDWRKFKRVSHRVNYRGVYTIYVRGDLLYLVSALKVIEAISVVLFKYSLGLLPSSQNFRGIVVVIVNSRKF